MRKLLVVVILGIVNIGICKAQTFQYRWLELYSHFYNNPAYIIADSKLQIEIAPYNNFRYKNKGLKSSVYINTPKKNSGFGAGYSREGIFQLNMSSLHLDYAYNHSLTENISLTGGIRLTYGVIDFVQSNYPDYITINKTAYSITLGTQFKYKKFHAGASAMLPLINRKKYYISEDVTESTKDFDRNYSYNFLCGYSLGKRDKILFDPVLNVFRTYETTGLFIGSNTLIKNIVGVGFTVGDVTSLSASLNFKNHVSMILGIYSNENFEYTLNFSEMSIMGQIRIKL